MAETKQSYATKAKVTNDTKAKAIVDAVLLELSTRNGFNDVIEKVEESIMEELKATLVKRIKEVM